MCARAENNPREEKSVEVTDAMIKAGVEEYASSDWKYDPPEKLVVNMYRAMARARPDVP
jgi:hypothetical protein